MNTQGRSRSVDRISDSPSSTLPCFWGLLLALAIHPSTGHADVEYEQSPDNGGSRALTLAITGPSKKSDQRITFRPLHVYAPGALVVEARAEGPPIELPRSNLDFFASAPDGSGVRHLLSKSRDGADVTYHRIGGNQGERWKGNWVGDRVEVTYVADTFVPHVSMPTSDAVRASVQPGPADVQKLSETDDETQKVLARLESRKAGEVLGQLVVAVDTDSEALVAFGQDTQRITNFIAEIFAITTLNYERDLGVRVVQGHTILRTSASGPDPYNAPPNTPTLLEQVSAQWRTSALVDIPRAFVSLFTGLGNIGQGYLLRPVHSFGYTYCFDKRFHYHYVPVSPQGILATSTNTSYTFMHELGHNLGADHTHCTDKTSGQYKVSTNTIDQCSTFEANQGCFNGPVSCPTHGPVPGQTVLMSYCTFGEAYSRGCTRIPGTSFHAAHVSALAPVIAHDIAAGCASLPRGPVVSATSPSQSTPIQLPVQSRGSSATATLTFTSSGGSPGMTTLVSCQVSGGVPSDSGPSPTTATTSTESTTVTQSFAWTLRSTPGSASLRCTATPQGADPVQFEWSVSIPAGTCESDVVLRDGFEPGTACP
jgi:hypothetical protein